MFLGQLSYAIWLQLPPELRHKLVILFDIPRSGSTVVEYRAAGNVVTSDGYTAIDLQAVSTERMRGLLNSDSDNFYKLFEDITTHIDALLTGTFGSSATAPEERIDTPQVSSGFSTLPPFCDSCDSKGGRHKKTCPKNNHA